MHILKIRVFSLYYLVIIIVCLSFVFLNSFSLKLKKLVTNSQPF